MSMEKLLSVLSVLPVPLWVAELGALALVVLVFAILMWVLPWRRLFGALPQLAFLALIGAGGYFGYYYFQDASRLAERRALEDRASVLFAQTIQPGSVLSCIDGSPAPAMFEACERVLFAEPQRVAAAVAIVTERIGFLADALLFASARDAGYLDRIEPLRKAIEADPYGFVAYVLANDHHCTLDGCERFKLLRDPARVKENLRVRRFEAFMVKHSAAWREPSKQPVAGGGSSSLLGDKEAAPGDAPSGRMNVLGPNSSSGFEPVPANVGAQPGVTTRSTAPAPPAARPAPTGQAPTRPQSSISNSAGPQQAAAVRAAKDAAKEKNAAFRRQKDPVAGLPRVVPRDYLPDEDDPPKQTSGSVGAPTSIAPPRQNLIDR